MSNRAQLGLDGFRSTCRRFFRIAEMENRDKVSKALDELL